MTDDDEIRRLLVVSNAAAGSNDQEAVDVARGVWVDAGWQVDVVATESQDDLRDVVANVDGRVLVAAGGDGSLHAVVVALAAAEALDDVVVGLLPLGTGNDLARGLGMPLEPEEAARGLLAASPRRLDLLVDQDGMIGVNAINIGIGAAASERASTMKEGLGPAAYPLGAVAAGATEPGWTLTVTVDGEPLVTDEPVLHVVIGNGPSLGGGTDAAPGASVDDRQADVMVALATGPMARMGYAAALQRGDHVDREDVLSRRGREIVVEGEEHPWNVDGELPPPRTRSAWTLRPAAWRLLAPDGNGH